MDADEEADGMPGPSEGLADEDGLPLPILDDAGSPKPLGSSRGKARGRDPLREGWARQGQAAALGPKPRLSPITPELSSGQPLAATTPDEDLHGTGSTDSSITVTVSSLSFGSPAGGEMQRLQEGAAPRSDVSVRELFSCPSSSDDMSLSGWRTRRAGDPSHRSETAEGALPAGRLGRMIRMSAVPIDVDQEVITPRSHAAREAARVAGRLGEMSLKGAVETIEQMMPATARDLADSPLQETGPQGMTMATRCSSDKGEEGMDLPYTFSGSESEDTGYPDQPVGEPEDAEGPASEADTESNSYSLCDTAESDSKPCGDYDGGPSRDVSYPMAAAPPPRVPMLRLSVPGGAQPPPAEAVAAATSPRDIPSGSLHGSDGVGDHQHGPIDEAVNATAPHPNVPAGHLHLAVPEAATEAEAEASSSKPDSEPSPSPPASESTRRAALPVDRSLEMTAGMRIRLMARTRVEARMKDEQNELERDLSSEMCDSSSQEASQDTLDRTVNGPEGDQSGPEQEDVTFAHVELCAEVIGVGEAPSPLGWLAEQECQGDEDRSTDFLVRGAHHGAGPTPLRNRKGSPSDHSADSENEGEDRLAPQADVTGYSGLAAAGEGEGDGEGRGEGRSHGPLVGQEASLWKRNPGSSIDHNEESLSTAVDSDSDTSVVMPDPRLLDSAPPSSSLAAQSSEEATAEHRQPAGQGLAVPFKVRVPDHRSPLRPSKLAVPSAGGTGDASPLVSPISLRSRSGGVVYAPVVDRLPKAAAEDKHPAVGLSPPSDRRAATSSTVTHQLPQKLVESLSRLKSLLDTDPMSGEAQQLPGHLEAVVRSTVARELRDAQSPADAWQATPLGVADVVAEVLGDMTSSVLVEVAKVMGELAFTGRAVRKMQEAPRLQPLELNTEAINAAVGTAVERALSGVSSHIFKTVATALRGGLPVAGQGVAGEAQKLSHEEVERVAEAVRSRLSGTDMALQGVFNRVSALEGSVRNSLDQHQDDLARRLGYVAKVLETLPAPELSEGLEPSMKIVVSEALEHHAERIQGWLDAQLRGLRADNRQRVDEEQICFSQLAKESARQSSQVEAALKQAQMEMMRMASAQVSLEETLRSVQQWLERCDGGSSGALAASDPTVQTLQSAMGRCEERIRGVRQEVASQGVCVASHQEAVASDLKRALLVLEKIEECGGSRQSVSEVHAVHCIASRTSEAAERAAGAAITAAETAAVAQRVVEDAARMVLAVSQGAKEILNESSEATREMVSEASQAVQASSDVVALMAADQNPNMSGGWEEFRSTEARRAHAPCHSAVRSCPSNIRSRLEDYGREACDSRPSLPEATWARHKHNTARPAGPGGQAETIARDIHSLSKWSQRGRRRATEDLKDSSSSSDDDSLQPFALLEWQARSWQAATVDWQRRRHVQTLPAREDDRAETFGSSVPFSGPQASTSLRERPSMDSMAIRLAQTAGSRSNYQLQHLTAAARAAAHASLSLDRLHEVAGTRERAEKARGSASPRGMQHIASRALAAALTAENSDSSDDGETVSFPVDDSSSGPPEQLGPARPWLTHLRESRTRR